MKKFKNFYNKNRFWIVLVLLAFLPAIIFFLLSPFWKSISAFSLEPEKIKHFILSYEDWSIAVYLLIGIFTIVAPPVPNMFITIVGAYVFGFWKGLLLGLVVRIIGSTINYWLGQQIRKGAYIRIVGKNEQKKLSRLTKKIGWQFVFFSRFMPSTDTDIIAYAAGISNMNFTQFILVSFLGMLPVVVFDTTIGVSIFTNKTLLFLLIGFYGIGVLLAPILIRKFFHK